MVRFIGRYAATEAPKYPVAKVEWADQSVRGANGVMVDSTVTLANGSSYDVRWLLAPATAAAYKVRDAMVVGFWMTPVPQEAVRGLHRPERRQPARAGRGPQPLRSR